MMVSEPVVSRVFDIAHDLIRRSPTQQEIDGRFLFEIWDDGWLSWVKEVRLALFGQDSAPYDVSELTKAFPEILDGMRADFRDSFVRTVEPKSLETGLAIQDLLAHVITGSPIALPRLSIIDSTDGIFDIQGGLEFRPLMALLVYADDVSGDEISRFYSGHGRSRHLILPETKARGRNQPRQQPKNLIRTWTVSCLVKQGGMTARDAIAYWNHRYPQHSYGSPDETKPSKGKLRGESVTSAAQTQYSRDKKLLFDRLPLTR